MRNRIEVVEGDITGEAVDVVVNAANAHLRAGGGVDGAIHRVAGPGLVEELARLGGCPPGGAVRTGAHGLRAKHLVHAVGPVWQGGSVGEDALLAAAYHAALRLAAEAGGGVVAVPAIATGAFGFPVERAARVAARAVVEALRAHPSLACVRFVCFDAATRSAFQHAVEVTFKELGWEAARDEGPPVGSGAASPRWMGSD